MVLAAVEDLFFLAKIQQTAKLVGVAVEAVHPKKLQERIAQVPVRAVILDLNHRSGAALEALRALKSNPSTNQIPVVGFVSHVQTDLVSSARAAGCDQVVARSAFVAELPQLLAKRAGKDSASKRKP